MVLAQCSQHPRAPARGRRGEPDRAPGRCHTALFTPGSGERGLGRGGVTPRPGLYWTRNSDTFPVLSTRVCGAQMCACPHLHAGPKLHTHTHHHITHVRTRTLCRKYITHLHTCIHKLCIKYITYNKHKHTKIHVLYNSHDFFLVSFIGPSEYWREILAKLLGIKCPSSDPFCDQNLFNISPSYTVGQYKLSLVKALLRAYFLDYHGYNTPCAI